MDAYVKFDQKKRRKLTLEYRRHTSSRQNYTVLGLLYLWSREYRLATIVNSWRYIPFCAYTVSG